MMTPSELREYEFKGAGRNAYKSDDVDNFFGQVAVAYEKIFRENAELVKRIGLLADRLEKFKNDEAQIKQAVIGAQKAADIIVREAEASVEDSKAEAEAILAAAKGEAEIIKSDAEKQAIADSDLLLSIARDKAEQIINKAKEEAHGIIIEANDNAKNTVGAATRTLTSESLHYEMLKKEVSEFRASILAQYKAHIEMISKLPELAVEQSEAEDKVQETDEVNNDIVEEISSVDPENDIIEYLDNETVEESVVTAEEIFEEEPEAEPVVKTTLPYDFFEEDTSLEFVTEENDADEQIEDVISVDEVVKDTEDVSENIDNIFEIDVEKAEDSDFEKNETEDIPISKAFSAASANISEETDVYSNSADEIKTMFASFETIEDEEDEDSFDEPKKKRGFFRRKK